MAWRDKEKEKAWHEANKDRKKETSKKWYEANKDRVLKNYHNNKHKVREHKNAVERLRYNKNKDTIRNKEKQKYDANKEVINERRRPLTLLMRYGITIQQRHDMIESQGNMCKICRTSFLGLSNKYTATDHCHKREAEGKKVVRGILCYKCNIGLGFACDNPKILRAAAKYLEDFEKSQQPKQLSLL